MLIDELALVLEESGCLDKFWQNLDLGQDATLGVASSARPFLVAARFARHPQPTLVVVAGEAAAVAFARSAEAYLGDERILHFPERADFPFNSSLTDARIIARRSKAVHALLSGRDVVVVTSARALLRTLAPPETPTALPLVLEAGKELSDMAGAHEAGMSAFEDVARLLVEKGYRNTKDVDGPGTFCVRGGTIDVFAGNLAYPVRLDFFADELDEIRRIVPSTGQSITSLSRVEIYPVSEFDCSRRAVLAVRKRIEKLANINPVIRSAYEKSEGGLLFDGIDILLPYLYSSPATLGDYVSDKALSVLIEPRSLFDDMTHAYNEVAARAKGAGIALKGLFAPPDAVNFGGGQQASYLSLMRAKGKVDNELVIKRVGVSGCPDKLFGRMRSLVNSGYTTVFSAVDYRARRDMELSFVDRGLTFQECLDTKAAPGKDQDMSCWQLSRGLINVVDVDVVLGMIIPKAKLALVSISDTQGNMVASLAKRVDITDITFPFKPGDYVVHAAHGIAYFKELVRRDIDATTRDYLLLEYAEGDKLYVPVEQLDRLTRYVGPDAANPRLTRLNTADWSRAMRRVRAATKKLAFDLVDVYTRRTTAKGYRFSEDTPAQREMEEAFPYQETPDQLAAIADVKADMCSQKPMDRLICGDVGFGKTEVALRAAFKAVQDKKQVMVLCPTTILAQQHYTNFCDRFEPFGVKVEVLSRFRTPAQQAIALAGFQAGEVDVLIGTHRLLSRDVNPCDLGLVIIDEEQRFGVGHKEQLKNLRESVDVLTLSATPIPRTLQMSLSGVRDMSLILTPPTDRRPVKVYVGEWDCDVVSAAIRFELARKGQVYYVSNRVQTIDEARRRVENAAGEARIGIAHGQMTHKELERVMEEFSAGELDVLVATTIIESGIDNPHTNTLIIENSQHLGLAQMYQLKGRIGRGATQAYAYFMFPGQVLLTEEATARLEALSEHTDLGSGMRIAMRDLEIRGAGNLLGVEQSGNMSAVGFDLFAQMLSQALNATREGRIKELDSLPPALSDIVVNVPGHTYLPEEYIADTDERVLWYRKIACAATEQAVEKIREDLLDAHPFMPLPSRNLLDKAYLKAFACEHNIKIISVTGGSLVVEALDIPQKKVSALRRAGGRYFADTRKLQLPLRYFKLEDNASLLAEITKFLVKMFLP